MHVGRAEEDGLNIAVERNCSSHQNKIAQEINEMFCKFTFLLVNHQP